MSPRKKKPRRASPKKRNCLKRESDPEDNARKRLKSVKNEEEELKARKKKNFVEACKQVSCKAYFDHRVRLLLVHLPSCIKTSVCKHHDKDGAHVKQMASYAEESFKIELKNNIWYEALEVCELCISPTQYLSANVLRDVVEIMLNAHDDEFSEYALEHIIDKCQQVLAENFSTHPPCFVKSLRNCYKDFLTAPMDLKENTYTNRTQFDSRKGIVKYCMNRLEYEMCTESLDGPLVDKYENIPEEMKQSVKGLHWQKEAFEIYELLSRPERIERLIAVLESVIELLQFDLANWHSRYTNNLGCHIMRSHKPLMAFVLWSDNVLYTGAVTNNCKQILRLFVHMVHLQYPDSMLRVITTWLNTMVQTFYICETNSNSDYPNTAKYCTAFANEFYKIISEMPHNSIIRILEKIEPHYMRHLVGMLHIKKLLPTQDSCIINTLINFVKESKWTLFPAGDSEIKFSKKLFAKPKKIKKILNYVLKQMTNLNLEPDIEEKSYGKIDHEHLKQVNDITEVKVNHVVHTLYITLEAYLDMYDIMSVEETWNSLNEQVLDDSQIPNQSLLEHSSYSVTEELIKKYKYVRLKIKELAVVFQNVRSSGEMPEVLNIFKNIGSLEF